MVGSLLSLVDDNLQEHERQSEQEQRQLRQDSDVGCPDDSQWCIRGRLHWIPRGSEVEGSEGDKGDQARREVPLTK